MVAVNKNGPGKPMTSQQDRVYRFILQHFADHGCGPTIRDIAQHMQFRSVNGAVVHLTALEARGLISRGDGTARTIVPVALVDLVRKAAEQLVTEMSNR